MFFVVIGAAFLPLTGIQTDEALFGSGIYDTQWVIHSISLFGHRVPLMLLSYLGALKAWLYTPLFHVWRPSAASLRLPAILAGTLTIYLFSNLLQRLGGRRAAFFGLALLCTDTSFLLTTCYDWGPTVLQHLLLVSGLLCLLRFHQERRARSLAAGFLLFGLALWDKALFAWILSGLGIATVLVFPRQLWKSFTPRNLAIAILAFALGAAPLIRYNVRQNLETFRGNAAWDARDLRGKIRVMETTFSGQALFGYLTRDDDGHARPLRYWFPRLSARLSQASGHPENGFLFYLFLGSIAVSLGPWFPASRKPILFFLLAGVIAWIQMLFGRGVGGSVHHVILLWPFPTLVIALALAGVSRRFGPIGGRLAAAIVLVVACRGLLITNEYYSRLAVFGAGQVWTDAIYPLHDYLRSERPRFIFLDDWGMWDNLRILSRGTLPLSIGSDPLSKPSLDAEDRREVVRRLAEPEAVFVTHPDGTEQYPGLNARLREIAAGAGFEQRLVAAIPDRNGRILFEVSRFYRISKTPNTTPSSRVSPGSVKVRPASTETSTDSAPARPAGRS